MPLCDRAAGIFGVRVEEKLGQGCCGGGLDVFHPLLVPSSPDINLRLHPPPPAPPPPYCWSSLNHILLLLLLLGCVWLVPSSFPKWLVMHEVSVCMMCWVSIFILFIFSCHLCFLFFTSVHTTLGRDYSTLVLNQHFILESCHPHASVFRVLLFSFPVCCLWCAENVSRSSSSAIFRSDLEKPRPSASIFEFLTSLSSVNGLTNLYLSSFPRLLHPQSSSIWKMIAVWPQCIFPPLHDCFPRSHYVWVVLSVTRAERNLSPAVISYLWGKHDQKRKEKKTTKKKHFKTEAEMSFECPLPARPSCHFSPPSSLQTLYQGWISA